MFLIVGLGNPGQEYRETRHNIGFQVIEELANNFGVKLRPTSCEALIAESQVDGERVFLVKPLNYVNQNGEVVEIISRWFKIKPENILIIHDELELEFSGIRIKKGGGSGGHKGIKSVAECLESKDFNRIRIGIGRPPEGKDPKEYVLEPFNPEEKESLEEIIVRAAEMATTIIQDGIDEAIEHYREN